MRRGAGPVQTFRDGAPRRVSRPGPVVIVETRAVLGQRAGASIQPRRCGGRDRRPPIARACAASPSRILKATPMPSLLCPCRNSLRRRPWRPMPWPRPHQVGVDSAVGAARPSSGCARIACADCAQRRPPAWRALRSDHPAARSRARACRAAPRTHGALQPSMPTGRCAGSRSSTSIERFADRPSAPGGRVEVAVERRVEQPRERQHASVLAGAVVVHRARAGSPRVRAVGRVFVDRARARRTPERRGDASILSEQTAHRLDVDLLAAVAGRRDGQVARRRGRSDRRRRAPPAPAAETA